MTVVAKAKQIQLVMNDDKTLFGVGRVWTAGDKVFPWLIGPFQEIRIFEGKELAGLAHAFGWDGGGTISCLVHRNEEEAAFDYLQSKLKKVIDDPGFLPPAEPVDESGTPVGAAVTAIRNTNENVAYLYGSGVYQGRKPCRWIGGRLNPCIVLDNGKIVWGCECWWGPTEQVEKKIQGLKIEIVPVRESEESHGDKGQD